MPTPFKVLAELCDKLESINRKSLMIDEVSDFLKILDDDEISAAVSMILGRAFPPSSGLRLNVSWATIAKGLKGIVHGDWKIFEKAFKSTGDIGSSVKIFIEFSRVSRQTTLIPKNLTINEVKKFFENIARISGLESVNHKIRILQTFFSLLSPIELKYVVRILIGEMRTGFSEGLMKEAISKAFNIPIDVLNKALLMVGDIEFLAEISKKFRLNGVLKLDFKVFRPIKPMFAQSSNDLIEVFKEFNCKVALEFKLDGARIQIHKSNGNVKIYSRRLIDVTNSLPEVVDIVLSNLKINEVILEGEVIAVGDDNKPLPFQYLMRKFKRKREIHESKLFKLNLYLFDIIYVDGLSLIDKPYIERRKILEEICGNIPLVKQIITDDYHVAQEFLEEALKEGHEGLMIKTLDSPYIPGVRGKYWLKIKSILEPLDLVIVAAEYGYGRRRKWLSDYYLAARDSETNKFYVIGKTFKGLTDEEFEEITKKLKELIIYEEGRRVHVIPKIVVEVLYNEIQKSSKYECGMALRFARINRIVEDKGPEDVDTIQRVREIYEKQFSRKKKFE
ncbi:MAG: ATP-dependent DNA ligase [Candidatus Methanomethylicia archaeon]|nr:ATP-dependent DNA ligase [Candidatus Methanomethylicia archaeon]